MSSSAFSLRFPLFFAERKREREGKKRKKGKEEKAKKQERKVETDETEDEREKERERETAEDGELDFVRLFLTSLVALEESVKLLHAPAFFLSLRA